MGSMQNEIAYSFTSSQSLTKQQLDYLNACLQNLPFEDQEDLLDVPEFTSEIVEVK
jgi:hypothetical protein